MSNLEKRLKQLKIEFESMLREKNNPDRMLFNHHMESFIILGRTITFVMKKELNSKEGFEEWYSKKISEMEKLGFKKFIDRRNTIEKEGKSITNKCKVTINFGGNLNDEKVRPIGTLVSPDGSKKTTYGTLTHETYFNNSEENESVVESCKKYIDFLSQMVNEASDKYK